MKKNLLIRKDITYTSDKMTNEALFHCANGYIGIRNAIEEETGEPSSVRGVYINGVYEKIAVNQPEPLYGLINKKDTIVNISEIQDIKLFYKGKLICKDNFEIVEHVRTLDMAKGCCKREISYKLSNNATISLIYTRAALFERKNIFLLNVDVCSSIDLSLDVETVHHGFVSNAFNPADPRMAAEKGEYTIVDNAYFDDGTSIVLSHIKESKISVATLVYDQVNNTVNNENNNGILKRHFVMKLEKDKHSEFTRFVSICDSLRDSHYIEYAAKALSQSLSIGKDNLLKEQEEYLNGFWNNIGFKINGSIKDNQAINFSLYNLLESAGSDGKSLLSAKGLSGEGYEGHYFWDFEMYIAPIIILSDPNRAMMLLKYRYNTLEQAKANATILGHKKGALYPWRTISGEECSAYFPSGSAQYHINGAIAFAIIFYYQCTKDDSFMKEMGLEILIEISRLWLDVGTFSQKGFVINDVTGPDEYTCIVNNNYYTNCCAKYDLEWTIKLLKQFGETSCTNDEIQTFESAAKNMFLPYDKSLQINAQDDSFLEKSVWNIQSTPKENFPLLLHYHPLHLYRYQVCKQADTILANVLYPEYSSTECIENNYNYYKKITTHDSSLSKCIFAIIATRLGYIDEAYDFFTSSLSTDLDDTHGNTKDGIHTANMGGSYLCILYGFLGLRVYSMNLYLAPHLPHEWKELSLKIHYQGREIKISIDKSSLKLDLIKGDAIEFYLYEKKTLLKGNETIIL